jgi:hypothetical protein
LLNLRSVRRGFRIIRVTEDLKPMLGVEKQEDLTLQAADFDRAVLIEDWHTRLTKFDGDRGQWPWSIFLIGGAATPNRIAGKDFEAPRASS